MRQCEGCPAANPTSKSGKSQELRSCVMNSNSAAVTIPKRIAPAQWGTGRYNLTDSTVTKPQEVDPSSTDCESHNYINGYEIRKKSM